MTDVTALKLSLVFHDVPPFKLFGFMSVAETHRDGPQSNRNRLDSVISLQATESIDVHGVLQVLVRCFAEIATRQSAIFASNAAGVTALTGTAHAGLLQRT